MSEKRFEMVVAEEQGDVYYLDNVTGEKITSTLILENKLNELAEENEQLKHINNLIDEGLTDEELTNIECLMLLIPFGMLFILLTMIIIGFLVRLGWVAI